VWNVNLKVRRRNRAELNHGFFKHKVTPAAQTIMVSHGACVKAEAVIRFGLSEK
jgi:hypothetical protein